MFAGGCKELGWGGGWRREIMIMVKNVTMPFCSNRWFNWIMQWNGYKPCFNLSEKMVLLWCFRPIASPYLILSGNSNETIKGRRKKRYGPVRNVLSPLPPRPAPYGQKPFLCGLLIKYRCLYNFSICISKDAEWSKTYFFMKEKNLWFLTETIAKMSQNIFAYFSVAEHSASFSLFKKKKKPILVAARGPPPLFTDRSVTNMCFLRLP